MDAKIRKSKFTSLHRLLHWSVALGMIILLITGFLKKTWMGRRALAAAMKAQGVKVDDAVMKKIAHTFDGKTNTRPKGIIYIVTGAGGQDLYNPEQTDQPDTWQKFTDKFLAKKHSLSAVDVNGQTFNLKQIDIDGKVIDTFTITK